MKKNLLNLSIALLLCVFAMPTWAQNAKKARNSKGEIRPYAAKDYSRQLIHPLSAKNGNPVLFPFAISGYYTEGFEGVFPPAGWQTIDVLDPTYVWVQTNAASFEGANSAYIHYSDMTIDGEDWLIMPQFSCVATDTLSFWLEPEFVLYPPDTTFILISTTDSLPSSFTTVVATLAEGLNYPLTVTFGYYSYSLAAFAGQDIYVAFANKNTYGDGILIDKVSIGTKPAINALALSIDMPAFTSTAVNAPLATVMNDGIAVATFDVTMTITGGYSSTKTVTALAAGGIQQVTFDPWTPVLGTNIISIQTLLAGDGVPADDTLSASINALDEFVNYGWSSRMVLNTALFGSAPAAINSNDTSYLFQSGGSDAVGIVPNASRYLPYSNSWVANNPLLMGTFIPGSFSWNNNIYVIGGYNPFFTAIPNTQIYDVAAGTWSNGAPMPTPVGDYASGMYNDSLFYVIAGYGGGVDVSTVQMYDPATNTWNVATDLPYPAAALRGGIVGNKIVVCCGYNQIIGTTLPETYVGTIDVANPSNISWLQVADYPLGSNGRFGAGGSLDTASGLVIFTAGDPIGTGVQVLDYTFGFDVNTNTWKIGPPKPTAVSNLANLAAIVDNDSLYIAAIGGFDVGTASDVHEWLNLGPYVITTGINEVNNDFGFSLNPNPVSDKGHASLVLEKPAQVKMVIHDVMGKEVSVICNKMLSSGKHDFNWNASSYSGGVYMYTVVVNGASKTYKLIKY